MFGRHSPAACEGDLPFSVDDPRNGPRFGALIRKASCSIFISTTKEHWSTAPQVNLTKGCIGRTDHGQTLDLLQILFLPPSKKPAWRERYVGTQSQWVGRMQELPQTRASLLLQLSEKSDAAWTEFMAVYETALLKFCLGKGLQEADCEDVIQDVQIAVIKNISTWKPDAGKGRFHGWLFQVARNVAVDVINRRARKAAASGDTQVARMLAEIPASSSQEATFEWSISER